MCIEFIKFLNKCFLLQSKYFFKVRFVCEIKLILPKCANIMRMSRKNDVLTMLFSQDEKDTCQQKEMLITVSLLHLFFENLGLF